MREETTSFIWMSLPQSSRCCCYVWTNGWLLIPAFSRSVRPVSQYKIRSVPTEMNVPNVIYLVCSMLSEKRYHDPLLITGTHEDRRRSPMRVHRISFPIDLSMFPQEKNTVWHILYSTGLRRSEEVRPMRSEVSENCDDLFGLLTCAFQWGKDASPPLAEVCSRMIFINAEMTRCNENRSLCGKTAWQFWFAWRNTNSVLTVASDALFSTSSEDTIIPLQGVHKGLE